MPVPSRTPPSDAFLAAIVNSSEDAILSKDLNGVITSWNAGAQRLFGYSAEETIGKPVTMLFPEDRLDEEPIILGRIRAGERVEHYETIRRRKDGSLVEISLTVSPIRDATGTIIGASKIARDMTAVNRQRQRFAVTLSSIGDAVIATDLHGRVTFMNAVASRLTGWTELEATGRPLTEVFRIVNETTRNVVENPVEKVLRVGEIVGLANHTILLAKGGQEFPIDDSAAPIKTATGELIGVVLVFRDVADRRRHELAALRLAAIVEGSDDAIIGKNLNGIITTWNPGAERLFGYTAAEMIGEPIQRLLPPERQDEEEHILARLQRGERVQHFQTVRRRKNGTNVPVSLTISPIRDEEGHLIGASKIARDISLLKEAEERLRSHAAELEIQVSQRTVKLQESLAELESFSYSLSHDMRAPLRAIQSFTEIVLADFGQQIPEGVGHLQKVIAAAARMDRLIQDVLAFARVSRGEIQLGPVDVEKLLVGLIQERSELQAPKAHVVVRGPIPRVMGNDASLTQVLTNFLHNAVKFVAPGVTPAVQVYAQLKGDRVRLCFKDNGIGIDSEMQRNLFVPFQRLPAAEQYQGTGVGLAIVRKSAERMKGTVGVDSRPGEGSVFWIELSGA